MKFIVGIALALILLGGCAARSVTPESVAIRAVNIMELILVAQDSVITAEQQGWITEDAAAEHLTRLGEGVNYAQQLPALLDGWAQLEDADKDQRLERARIIVFTLSQVLSGIMPTDPAIREAVLGTNGLYLEIFDLETNHAQ